VTFKQKSISLFWAALAVSLLIHAASIVNLSWFASRHQSRIKLEQAQNAQKNEQPVKINVVQKDPNKKIVEVRQKATEAPKESKYQSFENHQTERETKVATEKSSINDKEAGLAAAKDHANIVGSEQRAQQPRVEPKAFPRLSMDSKVAVSAKRQKFDELYLPSNAELGGQVKAGYQQFIDDELDVAEAISLNTTEYRYMGYFSAMRKAISMAWVYPVTAAHRGMQGVVEILWVIEKDGSVSKLRVLKSSGYRVLDDAALEAIRISSPFAPLPEGFGKERLPLHFSFRYTLTPYLVGH
jgi:periplasmic protein TonB